MNKDEIIILWNKGGNQNMIDAILLAESEPGSLPDTHTEFTVIRKINK